MKVEARITLFTVNDEDKPDANDIDIKVQIVKARGSDKRNRSLVDVPSGPRSKFRRHAETLALVNVIREASMIALGIHKGG